MIVLKTNVDLVKNHVNVFIQMMLIINLSSNPILMIILNMSLVLQDVIILNVKSSVHVRYLLDIMVIQSIYIVQKNIIHKPAVLVAILKIDQLMVLLGLIVEYNNVIPTDQLFYNITDIQMVQLFAKLDILMVQCYVIIALMSQLRVKMVVTIMLLVIIVFQMINIIVKTMLMKESFLAIIISPKVLQFAKMVTLTLEFSDHHIIIME